MNAIECINSSSIECLSFSKAHFKIQVMNEIEMQRNQKIVLKCSFYLYSTLILSYSNSIFSIFIDNAVFSTLHIHVFQLISTC